MPQQRTTANRRVTSLGLCPAAPNNSRALGNSAVFDAAHLKIGPMFVELLILPPDKGPICRPNLSPTSCSSQTSGHKNKVESTGKGFTHKTEVYKVLVDFTHVALYS